MEGFERELSKRMEEIARAKHEAAKANKDSE
jgi:hypothetical protein